MTAERQEYEAAEAAYRAALAEVCATRRRLRAAEEQLPIYQRGIRIWLEMVHAQLEKKRSDREQGA